MTDATPCGIIVKNLGLDDAHGCRLPEAHTGPHEFVTSGGEVTQWETDFNCQCEHCQACEGDYCISYWPKTEQLTTAELDAIVRPLATAKYEVDYDWSGCERMLEWLAEGTGQPVELIPDFQRGHVWTAAQQQHFIENVLRGVVGQAGLTLRFNAPSWDHAPTGDLSAQVVCIDGLQRLTAVRRFLQGEVKPFGFTVHQLSSTRYGVLTHSVRFRFRVAVHTFQDRTELLQHYLDINAGGTPHSESEIDRVRGLLQQRMRKAM